jgi:SAM-dependent methyltransferase
MAAAACRICGASGDFVRYHAREMLHGTRQAFDYVECDACGCVQIADIPGDLSPYYPAGYFSFRSHRSLDRNLVRRFVDPRRVASRFGRPDLLGAFAERISRPFDYVDWIKKAGLGPQARILDVGCGAGKTLLNMALGGFPKPAGVDPFIAETIRYECGVTVHRTSLEAFAAERASCFDFIMFHNSLEHLIDPLAALTLAARMLAPGGRVLVVVPVADSWAWTHYRENWFALDPPRHIHLLTSAAMDILARGAGLAVRLSWSTGAISQFVGGERYLRDIPLSDKRRDRDLFSRGELAEFRRRVEELNRQGQGDQTAFILARDDSPVRGENA